jgi:hypothetical protein
MKGATMALTLRPRVLVLLALGLLTAGAGHAAILYQETFPYSTAATGQDQELRNQGWCGGNAGDNGCNNPPGTVANNGGEGAISAGGPGSTLQVSQNVNNSPQGTLGLDSFGFWSQTGISADSFFYTEEFKLQSSALSTIRWDVRDGAPNASPTARFDPQHLAFRIGANWYISDQIWTNSNIWATNSVDLVNLTFFMRPSIGGVLPGGNLPGAAGGLALPDAEINAFGLWWDGPKTANSRIDNFTLIGAVAVPNPPTLALVALALAGLVWSRRHPGGRLSPPA